LFAEESESNGWGDTKAGAQTYNFAKIMSSFRLSLHRSCPPLFNGIAYRMKNFFFGAGQTNGWGQFSCFCLTVECDFYAFLCANEKKQAKFSIKRIHIILCRWCSATIKISSLSPSHSLKLYILFFFMIMSWTFVDSLDNFHIFFSSSFAFCLCLLQQLLTILH
jgi:hypothetical protein